jgi:solute carrier family 25 phosphate transporter 23/24/25/41
MPLSSKPGLQGVKAIVSAIARIYAEGGLLAFWTGNLLSVTKILPESAIKFLTYESSVSYYYPAVLIYPPKVPLQKRAFAKHLDKVEDSKDISGTSRFLSGGIGGITSQLSE